MNAFKSILFIVAITLPLTNNIAAEPATNEADMAHKREIVKQRNNEISKEREALINQNQAVIMKHEALKKRNDEIRKMHEELQKLRAQRLQQAKPQATPQ